MPYRASGRVKKKYMFKRSQKKTISGIGNLIGAIHFQQLKETWQNCSKLNQYEGSLANDIAQDIMIV